MSEAWMTPVTLWREPVWALALRVAVRLGLAFAWAIGAMVESSKPLSMVLSFFRSSLSLTRASRLPTSSRTVACS